MQSAPSEYTTAIRRGHHVTGKPFVIGEWNYNWSVNTTVTNELEPTQKWPYNEKYFPIQSITDGFRPEKSGIFYAFTNRSFTVDPRSRTLDQDRYYTTSSNQQYKYWISPVPSNILNNLNIGIGTVSNYDITNVKPKIVYASTIKPNKIRAVFNTACIPTDWTISYSPDGIASPTVIATNPVVDPVTGVCEIWFNGTSWGTTQQLNEDVFVTMKTLNMQINRVSEPNTRVELVEFAAIKEVDLTQRLVSFDVDMSMDEENFMYPVGQISSNSGSIRISNHDLKITEDFRDGPYSGLLDSWVQIRIYVDYDLSDYSGASSNKIRVGTMYSNEWSQSDQREFELQLFDIIKILQEIDCPPMDIDDQSLARIISRILDAAGIDCYKFQYDDFDPSATIKHFWSNGEQSLYDCLKSLCESHQAAVFADELGNIQLLTRDQIANEDDVSLWTFLGQDDGLDIPDIVKLDKKYHKSANVVTIKYKKMQIKTDSTDLTDQPLTTKLWVSDDSVVLKSSPLTRDMTTAVGQDIWVPRADVASWPFKGKANVDGEVFEYEGKGYQLWDHSTGTVQEKVAKNIDDVRKYDLESFNTYPSGGYDPAARTNSYTGRLRVTKRDVNGLGARTHTKNVNDGWWMLNFYHSGTSFDGTGRFWDWGGPWPTAETYTNDAFKVHYPWYPTQARWSLKDSVLTCRHTDGTIPQLVAAAMHGLPNNQIRQFATRMKFDSPYSHGGLIINSSDLEGYDPDDQGPVYIPDGRRCYLINLMTSDSLDNGSGLRTWQNEIFCEVRNENGTIPLRTLVDTGVKGVSWPVENGKWYDLEVVFVDELIWEFKTWSGIQVYIDGQYVQTFLTEDRIHPTRLAGLMVRGDSVVHYEHFFATTTKQSDFGYNSDDKFDAFTIQLPAGTNVSRDITIPKQGGWSGDVAVSISSDSSVTVNRMYVYEDQGKVENTVSAYDRVSGTISSQPVRFPALRADQGTFTIPAFSRVTKQMLTSGLWAPGSISLDYTSATPISVCIETCTIPWYLYNGDLFNAPTDESVYDINKGGYLSDKYVSHIVGNERVDKFLVDDNGDFFDRAIFFEEFGSIVHEIRDFTVDLDVVPAKSTSVYFDNENIRLLDHKHNSMKGIFTITNISREDQIVSGTEELSESESIDRTLMIYGYALEDKGDAEEKVEDALAAKKYGPIKMDLNADWIFTAEEAKTLANWVVEHWSSPMETVEIEVFANSVNQIGDKVNIDYVDSGFSPDDLFIITNIQRSFDEGFKSVLTLRRVK